MAVSFAAILKKEETADRESRALIEDIRSVEQRLSGLGSWFDLAEDDELIESLIYEELSLRAKYSWLLKKARERGVRCL